MFVTVAVIAFATPVSGFVTDRQPRTMVAFVSFPSPLLAQSTGPTSYTG